MSMYDLMLLIFMVLPVSILYMTGILYLITKIIEIAKGD